MVSGPVKVTAGETGPLTCPALALGHTPCLQLSKPHISLLNIASAKACGAPKARGAREAQPCVRVPLDMSNFQATNSVCQQPL